MTTAPREILMPRVRAFTSAAEAASWYVSLGFYPVPVASRGKNPRGSDWERLRIDAASIPNHFNGTPQNIGALLGITATGSAGLTDADLDSSEALSVAPAFLPASGFVFGRGSKPASHWFYFTEPPVRLLQFKDPLTKAMLVELRGLKKNGTVGLQSVAPGSVHHSGELITFEAGHDSTPTNVAPDDLVRAVHKIAAGALLARYWPASGRHFAMLALAGTLARGGMTVGDALTFCRAVYGAVPTHTPEGMARIESEVADSFAKIASDEPATGFPSLAEHIDKKVAETALGWLGIKPQPQTVTSAVTGDWQERLQRSHSGALKATLENAGLLLRYDPAWQNVLAFNEFSLYIEVDRAAPWELSKAGSPWTDYDTTMTLCWLQRHGVGINSSKAVWEIVQTVARENPFHPVRDYLSGLSWDGKARLVDFLTTYLGAEPSPLSSAIGQRWMISAVARIMQPGCKADHVLLLEGPQGIGKSTALQILASPPWFTDHLSDLGSKDSRIELSGRWIIELGEFASRRSELERKAFLTACADNYRAPYERRSQWVPRATVFAASTNDRIPLTDETGGRRYWPVTCGRIDLEALKRDRDALWSEAYALYQAGTPWWDDFEAFREALAVEQENRYQAGPLDELILPWLRNPTSRLFNNRVDRAELRFDSEPEKLRSWTVSFTPAERLSTKLASAIVWRLCVVCVMLVIIAKNPLESQPIMWRGSTCGRRLYEFCLHCPFR